MEKLVKVVYRKDMIDKVKIFYVNMLKLYFVRDDCGVDVVF